MHLHPVAAATAFVVALAAPAQTQELSVYLLGTDDAWQHKLSGALLEVSGLATGSDGRLFAHNDERARVYELDPTTGRTLKRIDMGDGGERGDFEGIALVGERFFLVESDGTLYEFHEGQDKENMPFRRFPTGVGSRCEVEGLAYDAATESLLLVCKTTRGSELRGHLVIFSFSLEDMRLDSEPRFRIPYASLSDVGARGRLHPSGIEVHPRTGSIFVVAAREEGLVEISRDGRFLAAAELARRLHRQPEGITFSDAAMLVADEGGGGSALLTGYPRIGPTQPPGPGP
jgi:uncharacterized protein YjiK